MARYSPEELKGIAMDALQARDAGDMRFHIGVHILCDIFGISEEVCLSRIEQLAEKGVCDE
jgi:DNA-binding Lrp family transcriptional regulator